MRGFFIYGANAMSGNSSDIWDSSEPLEQRSVLELVNEGYSIDLILEQKIDRYGTNQYYLYAKYRNAIRPIYTQRSTQRSFANLERALDWGKRMGFANASLVIDYSEYPDV